MWAQDKVKDGTMTVNNIGAKGNPAELLTKLFSRETVEKHFNFPGFKRQDGRHASAAKSDCLQNHEIDQQGRIKSSGQGEQRTYVGQFNKR